MKTIFIFDTFGEQPVQFFVLEGDFSHLDHCYLNSADIREEHQDELMKILYNESSDKPKLLDKFPLDAIPANQHGHENTKVVTVGFIP